MDWAGLYLRGAAMGVAELVPGVSGGTIAFITGIYVELLETIQRIGPGLLGPIRAGDFRGVWRAGNFGFIVALGAGMATSVFGLAVGVSWLLATHPLPLWGFFFGLILASTWLIARAVRPWTVERGALMGVGIALGIAMAFLAPMTAPSGMGFVFLGGAIAICAWILPGVSGSYVLLLLGLYPTVVAGVAARDIGLLAVLGAGCAVGLLSFSRGLAALLRRAYRGTLATLTGVMAGSVLRLWPWRIEGGGADTPQDPDRAVTGLELLSPQAFARVTELDPGVVGVLLSCLGGGILVLGLDVIARRHPMRSRPMHSGSPRGGADA
jgi:putative membrane protein